MNFMPAALAISRAQRALGRLDLSFRVSDGRTRIGKFYQEGCLKARLPRAADAAMCEAVTLNISGGVAGGDRLDIGINLGDGAQVLVASQSAERIYRALAEPCVIATAIDVGAGARLDYLPQETILFDGFSLRRSLEIDLAADADFLGVESILFGRRAMGEVLRSGELRDKISIRRASRILVQDMTRLRGDIAAQLGRKATGNNAGAMASLVFAAPGAPARLAGLRAVLAATGLAAGATAFEGIVFARILAQDGASLRRSVIAAIEHLRDGRPMPRVWQS